MDLVAILGSISIFTAGFCLCVGASAAGLGGGFGGGAGFASGLTSLAQQPDEAGSISRTMFISLAIVETSGIYCFVVAMILLFANPFWQYAISTVAK